MCEFSEGLVAWLDGELPEGQAAKMERHFAECWHCRGRLDAYRQASDGFEAYGKALAEAALAAKTAGRGRRAMRTARPAYAAAAIAAGVAMFFLGTAPGHLPLHNPVQFGSTAGASQPAHTAQSEPAGQTALAARTEVNVDSLPSEGAVEIAIPADDIFPPGAVPAGVSFTADVTMGSDGSAEQIRLRPELTEFERKGAQR